MVLTIRVEPLLPKEEQQAFGDAADDDGLKKTSQQLLELEEDDVEDTDKLQSPVDDFGFHVGVDETASIAIKQKKDEHARDSAGGQEDGQGLPPVEELEDDWGLEEKGGQGIDEGDADEEESEEEEGKMKNGSK
eukprot:jgi/Chlat1/3052/Chrsp208S00237